MSVLDVASRIQQIQTQLAALSGATAPSSADSAAFADALSAADGSAATTAAGEVSDAAGATSTSAGEAVVDAAKKYIGVPYVWGGTDPTKGLDCSGLVQLVYEKFGVDLPRVSYQQARSGVAVESLAQARPGDLVAFGSPVHHIGIYAGDNKMIEAPRPGKDVRLAEITETPTHIRRVLPETATSATAVTAAAGSTVSGTPYSSLFARASQKYGVPATLLAAVAHQESGFNASAVSPAGARGLMQLMPATARGLGVDPMKPAEAVDGAAKLLKSLITEFGRVDHALAAYNAGPGAVHRYHGIPPYGETQRYVPAVLAYQKKLAS
ncbi:MAG: transglycosylase SLT domain-containing protein [Nocardioidaceae bacterium]